MKFKYCLSLFIGVCLGNPFAYSQDPPQAANSQQEEKEVKEKGQDKEKPLPSIAEKTKDLVQTDGFFTYYWDQRKGKILLQVSDTDQEFLYVHSLATGLGSNPVGLDRGQLGGQKVVRFNRVGPQVLMLQRNLRYRAHTDNQLERQAVEQSFAQSVVWGGDVVAETDATYLVDITSLLLSDMHGVVRTLSQSKQGEFSLDKKRSVVFLPRCKTFPDNTEFEATLTFVGKKPGEYVRQTTPTPTAITLRQHHSFIRLPDAGYRPRSYDVRSPSMFITFADYASPLDGQLEQRQIIRHRLIKKDKDAAVSEPIEPIVYYVDPGAPRQIQEALIEGASWWDEAFEAAGFKNAFYVKLLPPEADPLDVRYNMIQWVHRSTRGWSYGGSVIDPRTGEIIKGHVSLGSLRVRQDQLLFEGLPSANPTGPVNANCSCCGMMGIVEESTLVDLDPGSEALSVALARIRQLSAHEVGHTLGFVHNFAASTYGDRASVMDYPAPRVKITDQQELDLSDAYGVGIGEWDKIAVRFAYTQFQADAEEGIELEKILAEAAARKMVFVSDSDSRPPGAVHPLGNLWDNGVDPLAQLKHVMQVRQIALQKFDPGSFPDGTTTADIAQYFTPVYLHHRYQVKAVGKSIGGQLYQFGYANLDPPDNLMVNPAVQLKAISALLETIQPHQLAISPRIVRAISPRPYSSIRDSERLPSKSGRVFDPLAAARVAVDLTLNELLQPQRLARLSIHARVDSSLAPQRIIDRLIAETWDIAARQDHLVQTKQLSHVVRDALTDRLISLADNPSTSLEVRSAAFVGLNRIAGFATNLADVTERSFRQLQQRRIRLFLERPFPVLPDPRTLPVPPGDPIGG